MAFDFTGKKVLVTGAGRGIGRAIAIALAEAGCKVYALDKEQAGLDTLVANHANITPIVQDLSKWDETRAALEKLEVLDGLVNNAGILLGFKPALQESKEDIDKYMAVNIIAAINCIQVVGKKMVEAGKKGSIVNLSSLMATIAWPNLLGYNVSKAGLDMVTKQFALELGPHNVRVNSVNPIGVKTDMFSALENQDKDLQQNYLERMPLGRMASLDDVTGPVMYLLSDYAAMVTGTSNLVDGGIACNITTKQ